MERFGVRMKALTLHQPWASLVAVGAKSIETRSWPTKYRGRLLIHAAKQTVDHPGICLWQQAMEHRDPVAPTTKMGNLPLGAVVASAMLTDCVPINTSGAREDWPCVTVGPSDVPTWALHYATADLTPGDLRSVTDQLPFGDFTPGRWAWLFDDVKPTTERCPRCWGTAHVPHPEPPRFIHCSTCSETGRCEPVSMRGKQGLWNPERETAS